MKRLFAALGTCGLAIGAAIGNPPAPVPAPPSAPAATSSPSVSALIANLGSEDFRTREAATSALERAGAAAMPALREALKSEDPEVRQRAGGVLFRLRRTADSSELLTAKKVTLTYSDAPLGTALNDLRTRTGLNITLDPARVENPLRKVTCVTGELPVWEALDKFCAAAGLQELHRAELDVPKQQPQGRRGWVAPPSIPNADAVPIVLIDGKGSPAGSRGSAVRVVALPRSFSGHRVTLGTGETTLCFDIAPVAGINWQDVVAVKINKLIDDAGRPGGAGTPRPAPAGNNDSDVVVAWGGGPGGGFNPGFGGRFDRNGMPIPPDTMPNPRIVPVPLKLGTPTARSIKRLEGVVIGEILIQNQALITIADPAKHAHTPFDGPGQMRLTVNGTGEPKGNHGATVQVTLQYPSPWVANARRGLNPGGIWPEAPSRNNQPPVVKAYDAAGKEMSWSSSNPGFIDSSDDGMTMFQNLDMTFRKDAGKPAKLVLVGPRPVVVEVPFALDDVPLP